MSKVMQDRLPSLRDELELEFIRNPEENFVAGISHATINVIATCAAAITYQTLLKAAKK